MSVLLAVCVIAGMAAIVFLFFKPYDYGAGGDRLDALAPQPADEGDDEDATCWRSVRIRPGLIACEYAGELRDCVFASRDAPPLPLPRCDERDCRCHYLFAGDRRSGVDRRTALDRLAHLLGGEQDERRRSAGRRAGDLLPA